MASRREFLLRMAAAVSALPVEGQAQFSYFDEATAKEVEALAAQIIPSDGTGGAREAGVVYFIDRALAGFEEDKREAYKTGLAMMQEKRKTLFPESVSIAALRDSECFGLVKAVEETEFFQLLREHTVVGFLGNPEYGGNRDKLGWKLIQFEDAHMFAPPFGAYDKQ